MDMGDIPAIYTSSDSMGTIRIKKYTLCYIHSEKMSQVDGVERKSDNIFTDKMKPKYNKIKNNFVQTPTEVTNQLLQLEAFMGNVLEPCCGNGAISEILIEKGFNVKSSDLFDYGYGEVRDLFDINEMYDNVITNPPFSLNIDMIEKLLSITKNKLALLWYVKNIGNIIESRRSKGLKTIYVFNQRIQWKETKIGWLFAWYVWEKEYNGNIIIKRIDI